MKKRYLNLLKRILVTAISVSMIIQPVAPVLAEEADGYAETVEVGGSSEEDVTLDAEDTEDITAEAGADEASGQADSIEGQADSIEGQTDSVEGQADAVEGQSGAETLDDATAAVLAQTEAAIAANDPDFEAVQSEESVEVSGVEEEVEAEAEDEEDETVAEEEDAAVFSDFEEAEAEGAYETHIFDPTALYEAGTLQDGDMLTNTGFIRRGETTTETKTEFDDGYFRFQGKADNSSKITVQKKKDTEIPDEKTFTDPEGNSVSSNYYVRYSPNGIPTWSSDPYQKIIKFTTAGKATIKMYWEGGGLNTHATYKTDSKGREWALYSMGVDEDGVTPKSQVVYQTNDNTKSDGKGYYISEFTVKEPGDYYLGCYDANNYLYYLEVSEKVDETALHVFDPTELYKAGTLQDGDMFTNTGFIRRGETTTETKTEFDNGYFRFQGKADNSSKITVQKKKDTEIPDEKTFTDPEGNSVSSNLYVRYSPNGIPTWSSDPYQKIIKFTTAGKATVKMYWEGGGLNTHATYKTDSKGREWALYSMGVDEDGITPKSQVVYQTNDNTKSDGKGFYISEFTIKDPGDYYLGCYDANNYLYRLEVAEKVAASVTHKFNATELYEAGTLQDGDMFTNTGFIRRGETTTETKTEFDDGYFRFQGKADNSSKITVQKKKDTEIPDEKTFTDPEGNSVSSNLYVRYSPNGIPTWSSDPYQKIIRFTTTYKAKIKMYWEGGGLNTHATYKTDSKGREWALYSMGVDEDGVTPKSQVVYQTNDNTKSDGKGYYISEFTVKEPGTYYLGCYDANNYLYYLEVTETEDDEEEEEVVDWDSVPAPKVIGAKSVYSTKDGVTSGSVTVSVNGVFNKNNGAAEVVVFQIPVELELSDPTDYDELSAAATNSVILRKSGEATFAMTKSGTFRYIAAARRSEKDEVTGEYVYPPKASEAVIHTYRNPLGKLEGVIPSNAGGKKTDVIWSKIDEADYYVVTVSSTDINIKTTQAKTTLDISRLTMGKDYTISVTAYRDTANWKDEWSAWEDKVDISTTGTAVFTAKDKKEVAWSWATFGSSTSKLANIQPIQDKDGNKGQGAMTGSIATTNSGQDGYIEYLDDEGDMQSVRVYAVNSGGKAQEQQDDGLSFYYTPIPSDKNFTLTAKAHINNWSYSNGQEGFGLMAADSIGPHGGGAIYWNNSIQAILTKSQFNFDNTEDVMDYTEDTSFPRYTMTLGPCSRFKYGITKENYDEFINNNSVAVKKYFTAKARPLDHLYASLGKPSGTYNLAGNLVEIHSFDPDKYGPGDYTAVEKIGADDASDPSLHETDFYLTVKKNNDGYYVTFKSADGKRTETNYCMDPRFYDDLLQPRTDLSEALKEKGIMETIDPDYVYAGFFAARNTDITYSDIKLETTDAIEDEKPTAPKQEKLANTSDFISAPVSNSTDYTLQYYPAWKGQLNITNASGKSIFNKTVEAFRYVEIPVDLSYGSTTFYSSFTPDKEFHPGWDPTDPTTRDKYNIILDSYATRTSSLTVNLRSYGEEGTYLYVSPYGTSGGDGTRAKPLDIYTAVKYVRPGQQILLAGGTYKLTSQVPIYRGVNGTADKRIIMMADPDAKSRPVLDFLRSGTGISLAGNYWTIKGIEIKNTANKYKGLSVGGSYNRVEDVIAHHCGNNGIEISRHLATDNHDAEGTTEEDGVCRLWPHDNLILNCTSYENADSGYEDADGFACKLTAGENNVFDGCLSYFNSDDGWDLFAKPDTGVIGRVLIKNSICFGNGLLHRDTDGDGKLEEIVAANGNGFKLGGNAIEGKNTLINCFSFYNHSKGIDSNSNPELYAFNCISFNNNNYNFALYTKNKRGTDYTGRNLISFRTAESFAANKYSQDELMAYDDDYRKGKTNKSSIVNQYNYFTNLKDYYVESGSEKHDDASDNLSKNSQGKVFLEEYFKSTEFDRFNHEKYIKRKADGTLYMPEFLQLTDEAYNELGLEGRIEFGGALPSYMPDDEYVQSVGPEAQSNMVYKATDLIASSGTIEKGTNDSDSSMTGDFRDVKSIVPAQDTVVVCEIEDQYYTGSAILPILYVTDGISKGMSVLVKGKDYYYNAVGNNVNVGTVKLNVVGMGNYTGKYFYKGGEEVTFNIIPVPLDNGFTINRYDKKLKESVDVEVIEMDNVMTEAVNGKPHTPVPVITYNNGKGNKKLKKDTDFAISYLNSKGEIVENMTEAGSYTISVNGINNFSGSRNVLYNLYDPATAKDIKKLKLTKKMPAQNLDSRNGNQPFNLTTKGNTVENGWAKGESIEGREGELEAGEELMYPVTLDGTQLVLGKDYAVSYTKNRKKGKGRAVIVGLGSYGGKVEKKFSIKPAKLKLTGKAVTVSYNQADLYPDGVDYTGSPITLNTLMKVYYTGYDNAGQAQNQELVLGRDYDITYKRHRYAGRASAVVKGKGDYTGKFTHKYMIKPLSEKTVLEKLGKEIIITTVAEKDDYGYYRNYQRDEGKIDVEVSYTVNGKTSKLKQGKDYTLSFFNNKKTIASKDLAGLKDTDYALYQVAFCSAMSGRITNAIYNEKAKANGLPENEMRYTIREGELSSTTAYMDTNDIVWKNAKTKPVTKYTIYEYSTGMKLKVGQDYSRELTAVYNDAVGDSIKAGDKVETYLADPGESGYDITVTATGTGRYAGSVSEVVHVGKYSLAKTAMGKTINKTWNSYDKSMFTGIELTTADWNGALKDGKDTLSYSKDYTLVYTYNSVTHAKTIKQYFKNDKVGQAYALVRGLGKYAGIRKVYYYIKPKNMYSTGKAASTDTLAPITDANSIAKLGLDLTNANDSTSDKDNIMSLIKGSKITTTAEVKKAEVTEGSDVIEAKVDKKGFASFTAKADGQATVTIELDDADIPEGASQEDIDAGKYAGTIYKIKFIVETPAAVEAVGKLTVAKGATTTLTVKDMFGTNIDGGVLSINKEKVAGKAKIKGGAIVVDTSEANTIVIGYTYLNAKYTLTLTVQ